MRTVLIIFGVMFIHCFMETPYTHDTYIGIVIASGIFFAMDLCELVMKFKK